MFELHKQKYVGYFTTNHKLLFQKFISVSITGKKERTASKIETLSEIIALEFLNEAIN
jgi:hypothetical protein